MQAQELDRLIAEVGPQDDSILGCVRTSDGAHAIRFEDADVLVEWDATRQRLVMSCELGTPIGPRRANVYETLLAYNLMWRETGGLRMALTGPGGVVLQLVDLSGAEIEAKTVAIVAVNLAAKSAVWRAYFESEEVDAPEPPAASMVDFIRV